MLWENIKVNLKATNMDLTDPINDYVISRVTNFGKLLKKIQSNGGEVLVYFEVAKTTNHHKKGSVYRSDCSITVDGENFYTSAEEEDLYASIDACKDKIFREIKRGKNKKEVLFRRGARSIKKMFRGLSKRNPFTSK